MTMLVSALGGALFEVRTRDCLMACILDLCEIMWQFAMCRCSAAQAEERSVLPSPSCHAKPHANAHQPELMCCLSRCELCAVAFSFILCEAHALPHALVSCRAPCHHFACGCIAACPLESRHAMR